MKSGLTPSGPVLEGCFAIHKPAAISSAQVIRDVQTYFNPSKLFKPWLDADYQRKNNEPGAQYRKKKSWKHRQPPNVKMGHGGTLDPMATGVLVLGLGSGTKSLPKFLDCTKTYETVLLLGAATDTYDTQGKIVAKKDSSHVTKEMVEEALKKFRGKIMQKPPIFSALRMQGKRLYEYAREGLDLPAEIQERPVEVHELVIMEWIEGGKHGWQWPTTEAEANEKKFAEKVLHLEETDAKVEEGKGGEAEVDGECSSKRKRDEGDAGEGAASIDNAPDAKRSKPSPELETQTPKETTNAVPTIEQPTLALTTAQPRSLCPSPAIRLRMTVTSGFYVRTLCHDLGAALGTLGCMAALVRSRQGGFELGVNILEYDDLHEGEEVWGPKVQEMLENWEAEEGDEVRAKLEEGGGKWKGKRSGEREVLNKAAKRRDVRRNTSSAEED